MITEHAIEALGKVISEWKTSFGNTTQTVEEGITSMPIHELQWHFAKLLAAGQNVINSRL